MKVWHAVSAGVVVILASAGLARVISESAPPPPESATSTHADKANSSTTPLSIWDRNYPTNQPFPGPPKNLSAEQAQAVNAVVALSFAGAQTTVVSVERMTYSWAVRGISAPPARGAQVLLVVFKGPFRAFIPSTET
jgi:hypothetical protein